MRTNQRKIMTYYNLESSSDRKMVAHARDLSFSIKSHAHSNSPSTKISWQMILSALDAHSKDLLNKAHPYYQKNKVIHHLWQ